MATNVVVPPETAELAKSMERELTEKADAHLRTQNITARAGVTCSVSVDTSGKGTVTCSVTIPI